MPSLTSHRKPNGVTYVYHQDSYWDKAKNRSSSRQVCVGKLDANGEIIYNHRFKTTEAKGPWREARRWLSPYLLDSRWS
jgi:hypothetical protein